MSSPAPSPILFTIPNFISAGSGRVMLNILERLDRREFSPAVCVLRKGGALDAEVEHLGIPFLEMPFTVAARPYGSLLRRARAASRPFSRYGFRLWHSFHYVDDYTEPLIARFAGAERWIYTKKAMWWGSRAWLLRSYLASAVVADNYDMPHMMFDRAGLLRKVRVIPHGVPLENYADRARERSYRTELGIPPRAAMIGCVANLLPVKGHPTLLSAAADSPGVHLLLAGDRSDERHAARLGQLAIDLGIADRVHFLGKVSDVASLLSQIDLFVLPSRMEGCPVSLLEAMAASRACIATDIPGCRDLIAPGTSGLLVPSGDARSLAAAINTLVANRAVRTALGKAARRRVAARFTADREAVAYADLYRQLLR